MLIQKSSPTTSYGITCRQLQIPAGAAGGMECVLNPGEHSVFHRHHESEIFVIHKGHGRLSIDGTDMGEVGPGDVIYLRPFAGHALQNTSETDRLEFLALYWVDQPDEVSRTAPMPSRVLIFSTPPTPNGDLHLGHLSGPYIGADIYRRYLRQKGVPAVHITGRDDNQTYVKRMATVEKRTPEAVANDYASRIYETWKKAEISLDFFSSPNASAYRQKLVSTISRLLNCGAIVPKTVEELYDTRTGFSLHEGYVRGRCPHCGCSSDGNACEQCGRPNDCVDLIDPVPTLPGVEIGRRQICKLYFRMSTVAPQLAELVARSNMSTHARALSVGMLADGLPDICISHRSDWGIPLSVEGFEGQVVYVWFEMAAGYMAADLQANPERPFFADQSASIVHFYGFDNTYYHTLLFPAVYLALGGKPNLATHHVINELLFLRNEKFSTSRRHLIWAKRLLAHVPVDYVRWGLSRVRPELKNENFDLDRFIADSNSFFAGQLQRWLTDSVAHLTQKLAGVIPHAGAWSHQHIAFQRQVNHLAEGCERAYQVASFSPQMVTRRLEELVSIANEFLSLSADTRRTRR